MASRILTVLPVLLLLAGCGFRPMYAAPEPAAASPVVAEMSQVAVPMIPDRIGQLVRNELLTMLTPVGQPAAPRYVLNVALSESLEDVLIRPDDTASRVRLVLRARYVLKEGEAVRTSGEARSVVAFDLPAFAPFAAVASERDAQRQAAVHVAEQIKTRLGVWFTARTPPPARP